MLLFWAVTGLVGLADAARAAAPAPADPRTAPLMVVDSCKGVNDGALCTDRNPCTVGDMCTGGLCQGTIAPDGMPCTDDNQCTANDLCEVGVCTGTPVANGTPCTDGEVCTDPDLCTNGLCVPGPTLLCDDGDPCTRDTCVLGDGCNYDMIPMCTDAGIDAAPVDAQPADAEVPDASPDLPPDAETGGEDAIDDGAVDMPKIYEARGGACVCSTASAPRSATVFGLLLAVVALSRRRKKHDR